jgi:hypothetical protein
MTDKVMLKFGAYLREKGINGYTRDDMENNSTIGGHLNEFLHTLSPHELASTLKGPESVGNFDIKKLRKLTKALEEDFKLSDLCKLDQMCSREEYMEALYDHGVHRLLYKLFLAHKDPQIQEICLFSIGELSIHKNVSPKMLKEGYWEIGKSLLSGQSDNITNFAIKLLCELILVAGSIPIEERCEVFHKIFDKTSFIPTRFWQCFNGNGTATPTNMLNQSLRYVQNFMVQLQNYKEFTTMGELLRWMVDQGFDDKLEGLVKKHGGSKQVLGWPNIVESLVGWLRQDRIRMMKATYKQSIVGDELRKKAENPATNVNQVVCHTCAMKASVENPLKLCSKCKKVYYCSRECQLDDWKKGHKEQCQLS